jgi:hypothetical protein
LTFQNAASFWKELFPKQLPYLVISSQYLGDHTSRNKIGDKRTFLGIASKMEEHLILSGGGHFDQPPSATTEEWFLKDCCNCIFAN